jgi:hypothetical protein
MLPLLQSRSFCADLDACRPALQELRDLLEVKIQARSKAAAQTAASYYW